MTAAAMQQQATPAVPPRPSRNTDKDAAVAPMPKIPPRPSSKRIERSVSPNAHRFAPSPFSEGLINKAQAKNLRFSPGWNKEQSDDPIERSGSVPMPSVGEEGVEYSAVADEIEHEEDKPKSRAASPEQTRTVDAGLQLHAPKPSLPAHSAKQRVSTVTRTDSDKAASFGIGHPAGPEERAASRDGLKKKPSTSFSTASDSGLQTDDEQGIPEIGQRVPMNPHLGDVQAPSPAPGAEGSSKRHHGRKHSARGLPPGSYGLFGHGVNPQDRLEKAYYQKHPELIEKEHHTPIHDRQNDFAMSSTDLNKLVRDTASRGSGAAELRGTPTDEVGFKASQEYASRMSRPASIVQRDEDRAATPVKQPFQAQVSGPDGEAIHVDDPRHPEYRSYGDEDAAVDDEDHEYNAPILAEDEVDKDSSSYLQQPAVHPPPERRGSAFEMDETPSRPVSRPTSLYKTESQQEFNTTPLEDVEEYEPLFTDESKAARQKEREQADASTARHHFPSKDIWEDAPNSIHYTAEVSTPDVTTDTMNKRKSQTLDDQSFTPAQAFAQRQEELANREAQEKKGGHRAESFFPLQEEKPKEKPTWIGHQAQLQNDRPNMSRRFPSRDVWEDAPESHLYQTTVSSPKDESKPDLPSRPAKKSFESSERPSVPARPKPKQNSNDEGAKPRPVVSDKPKPQVPARPSKSSPSNAAPETSKPAKPPVPSRPVGGKIAALQAGFMSDLNKRLQLGPQAPKKEEEEEVQEEKEKAPLSDARKSRARGPQRRAPAKSPAPATAAVADAVKPSTPTLSFTTTQTYWAIDPEVGDLAVTEEANDAPVVEEHEPVVEETDEQAEDTPVQATEVTDADKTEDLSTAAEPQDTAKSETPDEPLKAPEPEEPTKLETLVANTAGETILEANVEKKADDEIEPLAVDDEVKS